jgi:hypothetical protein
MHKRSLAVAIALVVSVLGGGVGLAQSQESAASASIAPSGSLSPSSIRSQVMPASTVDSGVSASVPFKPTISEADYAAAKAKVVASSAKSGAAPAAPQTPPGVVIRNFEGVNQATSCGGCYPPDTEGAIGDLEFVETVNQHVNVYNRNAVLLRSVSLATFFFQPPGAPGLFDPRVSWDEVWHRWIVIADQFPSSSTVQGFVMAFSQGPDANGGWWIYRVNVTFTANDCFDFPQLGQTQDAVVMTANIFGNSPGCRGGGFRYAEAFAVAKARVYNGWGFGIPVFTGLVGTLAPPNVVPFEQTAMAVLIAAPPNSNHLQRYNLNNPANPPQQGLFNGGTIAVPAYSVPPNAPQPGAGSPVIDTSDNRFVNSSTQIGNQLWNAHTVRLGTFSAPRFYQINLATNTLTQQGTFFASGSSFDWNVSIAANGLGTMGDAFVTWTADDPRVGIETQVRTGGRLSTDPANLMSVGPTLWTDRTVYTGGLQNGRERWGDYSATTIDPLGVGGCAAGKRAWVINEHQSGTTWNTRIGEVGYC